MQIIDMQDENLPWRIVDEGDGDWAIKNSKNEILLYDTTAYPYINLTENQKRLIVAAPEIYACLLDVLRLREPLLGKAISKQIRVVLAKVNG